MTGTPADEARTIALISEVAAADQLARGRIQKALPSGMALSHYAVLNHLVAVKDERTPAQLARILHVTKGAMTNTLARLEAAGHVHIRPDWDDARQKRVAISPAGRAARDYATARLAPVFADVTEELGPDEIHAILPVLRRLRQLLEREI